MPINPMYDALLTGIEERLTQDRDPGDTHDYSSSGYNGFDDGYITAVYETIEAVREVFEKELSQKEFVVLICRGDERPPVADIRGADLILKVKPAARVSVLSAPGVEGEKVKVRYPDHNRKTET